MSLHLKVEALKPLLSEGLPAESDFKVGQSKVRKGKSTQTGTEIDIKAKNVARLTPAKEL
jgi:nucleoid DNA-binding protein